MLNINNLDDRKKMKNYHRTKDMINLLSYFPEVSPIVNLIIIENESDYLENFEIVKNLSGHHRIDSLITKPVINSIETGSDDQDFIELIKRIKKIDPEGVLVVFGLINEYSERYERYAGIAIGVSLGHGIYIDAVGKGFDGREVSKGIVSHENYFIPWSEIIFCNLNNFKSFKIKQINDKDYKKSREERMKFLLSMDYDIKEIEKHVPEVYKEVPDFIWEDVIRKIIRKIPGMENELLLAGFKEFAISGHTEGKYFMPWQMYDSTRYLIKK